MEEEIYHSEEVQDIIGRVPSWILRYGLLLLFFTIAGLFVGTYFIQYPDTLEAKVIITADNPPVYIHSKVDGKIKEILVKNSQIIKTNQPLATIQSLIDVDSLLQFQSRLKSLTDTTTYNLDSINIFLAKTHLFSNASTISPSIQELEFQLRNFVFVMQDKSYKQKIANIQSQISYQQKLQNRLKQQTRLAKEKVKIEKTKVDANQYLYDNSVVAKIDMNDFQKNLLDQQLSYENFRTAIVSNQLSIEQLNQLLIALIQQEKEQKELATSNLSKSIRISLSAIETWQDAFIVHSTASGTLSYLNTWANNQDIKKDEQLFVVISPNQKIIARLKVPVYKTSKMKIGQTVNIKLDNYPYEQFGLLKGKIKTITTVPLSENYLVTVSLPQDLKTTYKKQIKFYPEMTGSAKIIIKEERLLMKLFYQLKSMVEK